MIPICLITGFLGTGKTTLLRRIAEEHRERKWIYLINEFSALDVDGAIVSETHPDVISIPGGSLFCKCLVTEFIGQLSRIHASFPDAEGVVIEASGMADPRVMADLLAETGLADRFTLNRVMTIVEPRSFMRLIHTLPNIIHQVEAADLILLNKCDLFSEAQLTETELAVRTFRPDAHLRRCAFGNLDIPVFNASVQRDPLHGEYARCRDPRYAAFSLIPDRPVDLQALQEYIEAHSEAIYRVKGCCPGNAQPIRIDYSTAGFSISPAGNGAANGLAWICRGDAAERIRLGAEALLCGNQ